METTSSLAEREWVSESGPNHFLKVSRHTCLHIVLTFFAISGPVHLLPHCNMHMLPVPPCNYWLAVDWSALNWSAEWDVAWGNSPTETWSTVLQGKGVSLLICCHNGSSFLQADCFDQINRNDSFSGNFFKWRDEKGRRDNTRDEERRDERTRY